MGTAFLGGDGVDGANKANGASKATKANRANGVFLLGIDNLTGTCQSQIDMAGNVFLT